MTDIYPVSAETKERALIDEAGYDEMYKRSVEDNEAFWAEQARRIDWIKPFTKIKDVSFAKDDLHIRWFEDGTLNVCCLLYTSPSPRDLSTSRMPSSA